MAKSLRDPENISGLNVDICAVCGTDNNPKVCSRCKSVAYCCKEHQTSDWTSHKAECKRLRTKGKSGNWNDGHALATTQCTKAMELMTDRMSSISIMDESTAAAEGQKTKHAPEVTSDCVHVEAQNDSKYLDNNGVSVTVPSTQKGLKAQVLDEKEIIRSSAAARQFDETSVLGGSSEQYILQNEETLLTTEKKSKENKKTSMPSVSTDNEPDNSTYLSVVEARNQVLSDYVVKCLNSYGLCVFDNFLGDSKGTDILNEVKKLYTNGQLASGQVVNDQATKVRGDVITWVDGTENGCSNIHSLISSIDAILLNCQNRLGHYKIKGRSKAMVAVYPPNSSGFLRHVDNPSEDGRCVTCIYYLNKGWNSKDDGGLLRIFPEGNTRVANVEPKFDRILFFWSDRRNPHEVMPSFRDRYAVTVWYFDAEERRRAVKRFKSSKSPSDPKSDMVPLSVPLNLSDDR